MVYVKIVFILIIKMSVLNLNQICYNLNVKFMIQKQIAYCVKKIIHMKF